MPYLSHGVLGTASVVPLPLNVGKGRGIKIPLTPTREAVKGGATYVP